ncbi:TPA: hypothetical protein O4I98_004883 [Vibrio parahaemolyticus]|nr:hypothetical protein [Vibrio parahaemolyticus]
MPQKHHCGRCRADIPNHQTWCDDCYYPGIDDDYAEYQALLDEGYSRIMAATMIGWQDPVEAGAYDE